MKTKAKKIFITGILLILAFCLWTVAVCTVDVKAVGVNGTDVGFATVNVWFYSLTGSNMTVYTLTDWLGLVPVFLCMVFGLSGLIQLIKRKSLMKVDRDIVFLGVYYVIVILCYLVFEMIPINYRPVLIGGVAEASYPSSTTLLVLGVMPTVFFQTVRRIRHKGLKGLICVLTVVFSAFMVAGRLFCGVHWLTDIVGSVLLSGGLYYIYKSAVLTVED